jgi:hypothetical protein
MEANSSTKMRRLAIIIMACFIGAPLAVAPFAAYGQISFRPLTINKSLRVVKAFGPDDEDCVYEFRRVPRPNGTLHVAKKLICNE